MGQRTIRGKLVKAMHNDEFSISRNVRLKGKAIRQGQIAALFRLAEEAVRGDANEAEATVAFRLENGHTRTLRSADEVESHIFNRNVLITKAELHASSYEAGRRVYIVLDQQPLLLDGVWVSVYGEEGWARKTFSAIEASFSTLADVPRLGHTLGKVWRGATGFWAPPLLGATITLGLLLGLSNFMPSGLIPQGRLRDFILVVVALLVVTGYVVFISWMGRAYPER